MTVQLATELCKIIEKAGLQGIKPENLIITSEHVGMPAGAATASVNTGISFSQLTSVTCDDPALQAIVPQLQSTIFTKTRVRPTINMQTKALEISGTPDQLVAKLSI